MKKNTIIAKGRVKNVRNIRIKFNNEMIYRAVAEIEITQSYRGNCKSGELISVLIPCTIHIGLDALEHEVISNLRVGMNGIFMMEKYDQHSYIEEEGTILYLEDLAEYGFIDAHKYGFLENKGQLIFDRYTFKSIEKATKLDEVESYIKKIDVYKRQVVPIAIALIGVGIFIYNYYLMYKERIVTFIGFNLFIFSIATGIILTICVYMCYFAGTYYTFKRNIK